MKLCIDAAAGRGYFRAVMKTNTSKKAASKFQVRTLHAFWAETEGYDAEGFRDCGETSDWMEAKRTFWRIVQNNRMSLEKDSSGDKGVFIFDSEGNEIISETNANLGWVEYSDIKKP
jgi:hypothetical protein